MINWVYNPCAREKLLNQLRTSRYLEAWKIAESFKIFNFQSSNNVILIFKFTIQYIITYHSENVNIITIAMITIIAIIIIIIIVIATLDCNNFTFVSCN